MTIKTSANATNIELRNQGIIHICGAIKDEKIGETIKELVFMNFFENMSFKNIQIILNSCGGELNSAFMLTDFIEFSKKPVYITGLGICASAGILILCSGVENHRIITKNTSLLSHQYTWGMAGEKYHDLVASRKEQDLTHERMINHYLKHSNLNRNQIKKILLPESDVWLTPKEAKKYGLIDKIV